MSESESPSICLDSGVKMTVKAEVSEASVPVRVAALPYGPLVLVAVVGNWSTPDPLSKSRKWVASELAPTSFGY